MEAATYLFFKTNCEEALALYTKCGLGAVKSIVRHGDDATSVHAEAMRGKIMHSEFVGPGVKFYASDNDDAEPMRGFAMMIMLKDRDQVDRLFACLAEGGRVTTPLGVQPWGDYYGKLTDPYGVQWMLNCPSR